VPFPDFDQQPAVGGKVEGIFGKKGANTLSVIRVSPIISKLFSTDRGDFVPYASLPIGISSYASNTDSTIAIVLGSEYHNAQLNLWSFGGEFGLNANKTFTYLAGFVSYAFDEVPKFQRRNKK
jgi:hypothetical protein